MIFYPSCGDLNTNLKLLDDPKLFNAHFADPFHQQGFNDEDRVPADIWLDNEPRWSFTEHLLSDQDQFESINKKKMGSLPKTYLSEPGLENELIWLHQKSSDSSDPNAFSNQYCSYIDTERNNNINFKSQLLNFSMKNSDCYEEEDEKENFWIPNSIQSNTLSLSTNLNTCPLLITQKSMSNEKNANDPNRRCYTSTISQQLPYQKNDFAFTHYSDEEWKQGGMKWEDEGGEQSEVLDDQQHLDQQKQLNEQLQQLSSNCGTADEGEDDEDESGGCQQENDEDPESTSKSDISDKPDEMDTLLTFLSKFDEKVAAIWGHNNSENKHFENIIHTNPWETDCISSEFFNFQQIEDEHYNQSHENEQNSLINSMDSTAPPSSALITTTAPQAPATTGKYTIMNSMKQYFGSAPPEHEYVIIKSQFTGQLGNLDLLNHSEESSSFIKFIPQMKNQTSNSSSGNKSKQYLNETASNLKDMLHNLELDCEEEQEIIAACSKPKSSAADGPSEDLLTSWKTHFRTVIAQEILSNNTKNDCSSPIITYGNPQLPEFRTEYNEKEYVLYQRASSTAFQVRFKLCRENEKGNQTEDFSSLADFGGIDYDGHIHLPFIEYGKHHTAWLMGQYDEECGNGLEFDWSEGRLMDSSGDSFYDDSVYDDYDSLKVTNDNDSDYGQFHSFCFSSGLSGNNKQSKAIRRRAKGRPCKYFFMDGSCRRGNECKFSHDLITCRFWAEGSCLKGQSCPFLHCFLDPKDFESHSRLSHKIDTKYQLESESDFPALGSTKLSSRVPIEDVNKVIDMLSQEDDGLSKLEDQYEEDLETSGWPHQENSTNNWICSLINVNEKRKKKKH